MHVQSLGRYMEPVERGDWEGVGVLMLGSARKLASIGAEILICPDNTVHEGIDFARERVDVPWIHIADVVADEAKRREHRRLAILGTRNLMEGPVYPSRLEPRGVEYRFPEAAERERINTIIFDELVKGDFRDTSRSVFVEIIGGLRDAGCDAVVLGCTEIPLLIDDSVSPLPTLDSTRLLARAALLEATA